eukprot:TRINITY_DN61117_c0_g1_i1.p1 TRINITY_DN61117_c0_g1~~TRINITY_DN61117_c0_g1_i1.p1  ORF type:complete len:1319 (-),score=167.43 TRINITY_DN61117_c0_g1_i1:907-4863(-)
MAEGGFKKSLYSASDARVGTPLPLPNLEDIQEDNLVGVTLIANFSSLAKSIESIVQNIQHLQIKVSTSSKELAALRDDITILTGRFSHLRGNVVMKDVGGAQIDRLSEDMKAVKADLGELAKMSEVLQMFGADNPTVEIIEGSGDGFPEAETGYMGYLEGSIHGSMTGGRYSDHGSASEYSGTGSDDEEEEDEEEEGEEEETEEEDGKEVVAAPAPTAVAATSATASKTGHLAAHDAPPSVTTTPSPKETPKSVSPEQTQHTGRRLGGRPPLKAAPPSRGDRRSSGSRLTAQQPTKPGSASSFGRFATGSATAHASASGGSTAVATATAVGSSTATAAGSMASMQSNATGPSSTLSDKQDGAALISASSSTLSDKDGLLSPSTMTEDDASETKDGGLDVTGDSLGTSQTSQVSGSPSPGKRRKKKGSVRKRKDKERADLTSAGTAGTFTSSASGDVRTDEPSSAKPLRKRSSRKHTTKRQHHHRGGSPGTPTHGDGSSPLPTTSSSLDRLAGKGSVRRHHSSRRGSGGTHRSHSTRRRPREEKPESHVPSSPHDVSQGSAPSSGGTTRGDSAGAHKPMESQASFSTTRSMGSMASMAAGSREGSLRFSPKSDGNAGPSRRLIGPAAGSFHWRSVSPGSSAHTHAAPDTSKLKKDLISGLESLVSEKIMHVMQTQALPEIDAVTERQLQLAKEVKEELKDFRNMVSRAIDEERQGREKEAARTYSDLDQRLKDMNGFSHYMKDNLQKKINQVEHAFNDRVPNLNYIDIWRTSSHNRKLISGLLTMFCINEQDCIGLAVPSAPTPVTEKVPGMATLGPGTTTVISSGFGVPQSSSKSTLAADAEVSATNSVTKSADSTGKSGEGTDGGSPPLHGSPASPGISNSEALSTPPLGTGTVSSSQRMNTPSEYKPATPTHRKPGEAGWVGRVVPQQRVTESDYDEDIRVRLLLTSKPFLKFREALTQDMVMALHEVADKQYNDVMAQIAVLNKDISSRISASDAGDLIVSHYQDNVKDRLTVVEQAVVTLHTNKVDNTDMTLALRTKADLKDMAEKADRTFVTALFEFLHNKVTAIATSPNAKLLDDAPPLLPPSHRPSIMEAATTPGAGTDEPTVAAATDTGGEVDQQAHVHSFPGFGASADSAGASGNFHSLQKCLVCSTPLSSASVTTFGQNAIVSVGGAPGREAAAAHTVSAGTITVGPPSGPNSRPNTSKKGQRDYMGSRGGGRQHQQQMQAQQKSLPPAENTKEEIEYEWASIAKRDAPPAKRTNPKAATTGPKSRTTTHPPPAAESAPLPPIAQSPSHTAAVPQDGVQHYAPVPPPA